MNKAILALLVAFAVCAPQKAGASPFHPDLDKARTELLRARGPAVYAALRTVWGTWDRANPEHVEAVLSEAADSAHLRPPAQAYARLLGAYARLRRGDVAAAKRIIDELGYVQSWQIVGPFDDEGKVGFSTEYGPELELDEPIVPGRAYSGKERPVRFRHVPDVFHFGYVDTENLVVPDERVCVYLRTFVQAGERARPASIWTGVGGAYKVFWNGAKVLEDAAYRAYDAERSAARVTVQPGVNDLTVKACGQERAPIAAVRLADATGRPDPSIRVSAAVELSEAASSTVAARASLKPTPAGTEGPLQAFERLVERRSDDPDALEAFARYLVQTASDDPTEHRARDLARKAAEVAPTIERLLLAARLAEDRNAASNWVERAEALMDPDRPDKHVLSARAALLAGGLSPQRAFPIYDRVLAIDPDDVTAIQGRIALYNRAGLRRSALAVLKRAAERNPHSVMLLNMLASQLETLGRATEAAEARARYIARRFHDPSYLTQQIDLAVARRNADATDHWLERLGDVEPDSQWALGVSARAHRAFGRPERAIAAYERALELSPEDVGTLRQYAAFRGERGDRSEQLALLQRVRRITPQDKEVREYIEHLEPTGRRADERYAWDTDRFLKLRHLPPGGENRRTLVDLTVSTVFENGLSSQFRQVVFQPLTDAAAALARQYAFQYQADRQRVQLRGAKVFRGDGSTDEATESGEAAADNPAIAMYTSARTFYVQFPRLEPGDVVELRYRIDDVSATNEMADYFGEITYLQASEPLLRAQYVLRTPKSRTFYIDSRDLPGLKKTVTEEGRHRIYDFSIADVPPVRPEPSMPPWPSVLGFVHVSTFKSWQEMGKWYWGLAKDQFDLDAKTRELAHAITEGKKTELEKVTAVFDWVVQNTRYVALEFGIYGYKPRRCVQTVARGWGDCKDKATVIVSLLRELGIDATIVVVRTGLRGDFQSSVASLAPFDHAIAYVPSLDLYLDGTAEYAGATELPTMDLGALGLLVNRGEAKLVRLPEADPKHNVRRRVITAVVAPDASAPKLTVEYDTRGVHAPGFRRRFSAPATRRERLIEDINREFSGFEPAAGPSAIETGDLDDIEQPVAISVRGKAARFGRKEGDRISAPVTPGFRLTPLYASLSSRTLPIALPPIGTLEDRFHIKIPPTLQVLALPPSAHVESAFGSLVVTVERDGADVVVTSRLRVQATHIAPKDYASWKRFCRDVDAALDIRLGLEEK